MVVVCQVVLFGLLWAYSWY